MKLDEFCKTLERRLAATHEYQETLQFAALALQQAFKVKSDEVAFLLLDTATDSIGFVWPKKLSSAGNIPLSSRGSLAALTIRENNSQLHNNFSSKYHAAIFEQIRLDESKAKDNAKEPSAQRPIQKIMSVPLTREQAITGAVQVCRKGSDGKDAGADFTQLELDALTAIAGVIGQHLDPKS